MNSKVVKKIRKYSKQNWIEYVKVVKKWSFAVRFRYCWYIMFGKSKSK